MCMAGHQVAEVMSGVQQGLRIDPIFTHPIFSFVHSDWQNFSRFALLEYPDADRGRCAFVVPQGPLPILFPKLLRPEDRTYPFLGIL